MVLILVRNKSKLLLFQQSWNKNHYFSNLSKNSKNQTLAMTKKIGSFYKNECNYNQLNWFSEKALSVII